MSVYTHGNNYMHEDEEALLQALQRDGGRWKPSANNCRSASEW